MKNMSSYSFERLVINHGSDKMLEKLLNKTIDEIKILTSTNLKEVYDTIEKIYSTSSDEEFNSIVMKLQEEEKINNHLELIHNIEEFQNKNEKIEIDRYKFIEMLKCCNIKVPKVCYTGIECIRNDGSMRLYTNSKRACDSIFNAYIELINYKVTMQ